MSFLRIYNPWFLSSLLSFKVCNVEQSCTFLLDVLLVIEMPTAEAYRILSPGGHIFFCDQNPSAEPYAKMSPIAFSVFRSTEPYLAEYFRFDMENAFTAAGFVKTEHLLANARHHVYIGRKP